MKRTKTKSSPRRAARNSGEPGHGAQFTVAELERIAERLIAYSEADETEIEIDSTTDALTRFANNTIHQNVAERTISISVRAVVDGRTARALTNKTDEESLRRVAAAAATLARHQPENPDLLPMLGPQKYRKSARFFASTAAENPQDRARAVTRVCKMAEKRKQTAAGIFSSGSMQATLANSKGLFARHQQTRAEFSVTILEENSSGWAKSNSPDIGEIDPDALAESPAASARTRASRANSSPGTTPRFSSLPPCSIWSASFSTILPARPCSTSAPASPGAWAKRFSARTSRCGTTSIIRCSLALRTTAKACRGKKYCWWTAACRRIWFIRAPPRRK
jgi:hypothetical protein